MKKFIGMFAVLMTFASSSCSASNSENSTKTTEPQSTEPKTTESQSTEPKTTEPLTTEIKTMEPTTDKYVEIKTTEGDILIKLYGDTPAHQANFLKLVNEGYYDNTLFHRVIDKFMIQAGDPDSKTAAPGQPLGSGGPGYTIPAEINYPKHFHKRGALAAARQGDQVNPMRASSGSQFYIVTGDVVPANQKDAIVQRALFEQKQQAFNKLAESHIAEIRQMQSTGDRQGLMALQEKLAAQVEEQFKDATVPAEIIEAYTTVGGAPHLDGQYTVFGEVVKGMDVVDKIEKTETDQMDRPTTDIKILSAKVIE